MVGHGTLEVAKTVLEVADVAWTAMECCHHHPHHKDEVGCDDATSEGELESLRSENQRLRSLLEQNLKLLQSLSQSPSVLLDCPPDLHDRLVAAVESARFLNELGCGEKFVNGSTCEFPFKEPSDADLQSAEILINANLEEPSWWVWVNHDMVPSNVEEQSGIDKENYVVVCEEDVVDAISNFMARCILSNPKAQSFTPEELQKALAKALGGENKVEKMLSIWHAGNMFYTLSTWGLALTGLYKSRAVLRLAATGVHATSKVVLKAL